MRTDDAGRFSLPSNQGVSVRFPLHSQWDDNRRPVGTAPLPGAGRTLSRSETRDESGPLVFAQLSDIHYAPDAEAFSRAFADREMAFPPPPRSTDSSPKSTRSRPTS